MKNYTVASLGILLLFTISSIQGGYQDFDFLQDDDAVAAEMMGIINATKAASFHHGNNNHTVRTKKPWTFMVYMAADNDLNPFAINNLRQMAAVGSNQNINIVVHLDIKTPSHKKITQRLFVEKNKYVAAQELPVAHMDSGDPKTLVSFCDWAIRQYPADNFALILWNHGTGIIDYNFNKILNPAELFSFNPTTNRLELDRTIGFLDLLFSMENPDRGICWDNTSGNYLTNKKLNLALSEICTRSLSGKKLSIIAFDACLMSMIEVGNLVKKYADIMVSSEEVELGTGWNYTQALSPLAANNLDKYQLAKIITTAYGNTYEHITNDYTQSAINLNALSALEESVNKASKILIECLAKQQNKSVTDMIKASRDRRVCTHFDEPSYIDLHHFFSNIEERLHTLRFKQKNGLEQQLKAAITEVKQHIIDAVVANVAGKNVPKARGISIYFPEKFIHSSYSQTPFAQHNAWHGFLEKYLIG